MVHFVQTYVDFWCPKVKLKTWNSNFVNSEFSKDIDPMYQMCVIPTAQSFDVTLF